MIALLLLSLMIDAPAPQPKSKPSPSPVVIEKVDTDPPTLYPEPIILEAEPVPPVPPVPPPPPPPPPVVEVKGPVAIANEAPFRVRSQMGALITTTGDGGTGLTPTLAIDVEGPLAYGDGKSLGRAGARIGLSSAPGQSIFSVADVTNYKSVEIGLRLGRVIGAIGSVTTAVVAEGSFASRIKGSDDRQPLNRLSRSLGIGLSFANEEANAFITTLVGYDEASSSCQPPVICTGVHSGLAFLIYGQVPILDGKILFGGDVTLSAGHSVYWAVRRDIERVFVVVDPVAIFKK